MNSSLLQLEDYGLTDLSIKWEPMDQNTVEAKSSTAITYQVAYQTDNPLKYKLTLEFRHLIGSTEGNDHLSIQTSIVGYFLFQETMSLQNRERARRPLRSSAKTRPGTGRQARKRFQHVAPRPRSHSCGLRALDIRCPR